MAFPCLSGERQWGHPVIAGESDIQHRIKIFWVVEVIDTLVNRIPEAASRQPGKEVPIAGTGCPGRLQ